MKPIGQKIPEHRLKLWSVVVLQLLESVERGSPRQSCNATANQNIGGREEQEDFSS